MTDEKTTLRQKKRWIPLRGLPIWLILLTIGFVLRGRLLEVPPEVYWKAARTLPVNHLMSGDDLRPSRAFAGGSEAPPTDSIVGWYLAVRKNAGDSVAPADCIRRPSLAMLDSTRRVVLYELPDSTLAGLVLDAGDPVWLVDTTCGKRCTCHVNVRATVVALHRRSAHEPGAWVLLALAAEDMEAAVRLILAKSAIALHGKPGP